MYSDLPQTETNETEEILNYMTNAAIRMYTDHYFVIIT